MKTCADISQAIQIYQPRNPQQLIRVWPRDGQFYARFGGHCPTMSNRTHSSRLDLARLRRNIAQHGLIIWAALAVVSPHAPALAEASELAQVAQFEVASLGSRQCWARYSTSGAQPQNGQIEETAFRVPCPELMTADFIATLQRALAVRGHYDGPITGRADSATRTAVRAFQRAQGFDSPILTLDTAQRLGLLPAFLAQN